MSDWNTTSSPQIEENKQAEEAVEENTEDLKQENVTDYYLAEENKKHDKERKQQLKIGCLEAALRTANLNVETNVAMVLNGPDKVLEAAKKYYEFVRK